MDTYTLDTNVVFSVAMNPNSPMGRFVMSVNPQEIVFFAPAYLKEEINRHFDKLLSLSGLAEE